MGPKGERKLASSFPHCPSLPVLTRATPFTGSPRVVFGISHPQQLQKSIPYDRYSSNFLMGSPGSNIPDLRIKLSTGYLYSGMFLNHRKIVIYVMVFIVLFDFHQSPTRSIWSQGRESQDLTSGTSNFLAFINSTM